MSTSKNKKEFVQQTFAENKPMFITVSVFVGLLCATFFVQGPGRYSGTDRSSEWFARIVVFLVSGAFSAALLLFYMFQKNVSKSIEVAVRDLTDKAFDLDSQPLMAAGDEKVRERILNSSLKNGLARIEGANVEKITANQVAQVVARLAGILLILGVIGSIIIGLNPSEECYELFSSEYCEKDWTTSLTMGLVGLLLNSLLMLSIMMVALYIQGRTTTTED